MSLKEAAKYFLEFQRNSKIDSKDKIAILKNRMITVKMPDNPAIKKLIHNAIVWKVTLEQIIKIYSKTKIEKLHPEITTAIILGLAEFLFDENKIPAKVINDAVNTVETQSRKNYTNAVLRKISTSIHKIKNSLFEDISRNQVGFYKFDQEIFADPAKKPDKWLQQAYSLPGFLSKTFLQNFTFSRTVEVAKASNAFAPIFLRINTEKVEISKALTEMSMAGFELENTTQKNVFKLVNKVSIIDTEFFKNGWVYIQDLTSAEVTSTKHLNLPENPKILDACAAPGGKISNLYEQLKGIGEFTAIDISDKKLELLKDNFNRLGHEKIKVEKADFIDFAEKIQHKKFNLVIVDAPCSNTGVLARKPEARWRLKEEDLESLSALQSKLLTASMKLLDKNGILLYSTCSILRAENQDKIKEFSTANPEFKVLRENTWLPQVNGQQGGFCSILQNS